MTCPVCQSINVIKSIDVVDDIWRQNYGVAYCKECGLYFLESLPNIEEIEEYYETKYYNYSSLFVNVLKKAFRNFRCKSQFHYIKNHLAAKKGLEILEIGCGEGTLLNLLQRGNSVYGLEFNSRTRQKAYENFKIKTDSTDILAFKSDRKYDLIIMSHVLEHFTDIEAVLQKCKDILNKDGKMFIEVPCAPEFSSIGKNELHSYLSTPHIYNFSVKSIDRLVSNFNFEVLSFDKVFYNLRLIKDKKSKIELGHMFMSGSIPNLKYLLSGILYMVISLLDPKNSWEKRDLNSDWYGIGECLRMIVKKQ